MARSRSTLCVLGQAWGRSCADLLLGERRLAAEPGKRMPAGSFLGLRGPVAGEHPVVYVVTQCGFSARRCCVLAGPLL